MVALMLMSASMVSAQLTLALVFAVILAVLVLGTLTAPAHVRRLAGGAAVAVVMAAFIAWPSIIIRCPDWWIGCP